jgi:hypothetical protein
LASLGWDVLATDIPNVICTVLSQNIAQNAAILPPDSGSIEICELDWTVPPEKWSWNNLNDKVVASELSLSASDLKLSSLRSDLAIQPLDLPFDLIVTADIIYSPELAQPLLRTLFALCGASNRVSAHVRSPPIYLCIERRDPTLIDRTLAEARGVWGFTVVRIPHRKVAKAMEKGGVEWKLEDWEGVEIWKLTLPTDVKL